MTADRVFVTETVEKETESVRALDRHTGAEIWKVKWPGAITVPFFAAANGSWIRSTPACDSNSLYVAGMRDVLVSLDIATGQERWRVDFAKEFDTDVESFGFVCSPLLDQGFVFVQTAGGLVKLDCRTGKIVWRSLRENGGMMGGAFSSPIIAELAANTQGICSIIAIIRNKGSWRQVIGGINDKLAPIHPADRTEKQGIFCNS